MCVAWLRWNDTEAVQSSFSVEVIHGPGVEEQHMWFSAQVHQICFIQSNSLFPSSIIQVSTTLMHYLLALACCLINYCATQGYLYLPLHEASLHFPGPHGSLDARRSYHLTSLLYCLFVLRSCRRVRVVMWYSDINNGCRLNIKSCLKRAFRSYVFIAAEKNISWSL